MTTTTITTTATATSILAIDLGKYKSLACLYHSADDVCFHATPAQRDLRGPKPESSSASRRRLAARCGGSASVQVFGGVVPQPGDLLPSPGPLLASLCCRKEGRPMRH